MSSAPPPSGKTPTAAPTSGKKPAGRGLGRGLSSLLGDSGIAQAATASAALALIMSEVWPATRAPPESDRFRVQSFMRAFHLLEERVWLSSRGSS